MKVITNDNPRPYESQSIVDKIGDELFYNGLYKFTLYTKLAINKKEFISFLYEYHGLIQTFAYLKPKTLANLQIVKGGAFA